MGRRTPGTLLPVSPGSEAGEALPATRPAPLGARDVGLSCRRFLHGTGSAAAAVGPVEGASCEDAPPATPPGLPRWTRPSGRRCANCRLRGQSRLGEHSGGSPVVAAWRRGRRAHRGTTSQIVATPDRYVMHLSLV